MGTLPDQLTLELGQGGHDIKKQPTLRGRGIDAVLQGGELDSSFFERGDQVDQIPYHQKLKELQAIPPTERRQKSAVREAGEYVSDLFDQQCAAAMQAGRSFAYEGHFTEHSQWIPIVDFKNSGYRIEMDYLGLATVEESLR